MAKTNVVKVRLSDEEKAAVERYAVAEHRTVSSVIRLALSDLLRADQLRKLTQ